MAMTLRLTDEEADRLRQRAEVEGRSMQDVARQAIGEYVGTTSRRELVDDAIRGVVERHGEVLRRLADT